MLMCKKWRQLFKVFEVSHPKSAKIKTKAMWAKKYYKLCFKKKKEERLRTITDEICDIAFKELMEY